MAKQKLQKSSSRFIMATFALLLNKADFIQGSLITNKNILRIDLEKHYIPH